MVDSVDKNIFETLYSEKAPWDIGRPQKAFVEVSKGVKGSILDAGCGTGENILFFAGLGHLVTGLDFLKGPVEEAKKKAKDRGVEATFLVKDALTLKSWNERFDNVIDSGLFHVFSDKDRLEYVSGLKTVLNPGGHLFVLCFSDQTPGTEGPRRVSRRELRECFSQGWEIQSIEPAIFEVRSEVLEKMFSGTSPKTWFLRATRTP